MASPTVNVVRWTALISGIGYGILHQSTLQLQFDERKKKHQEEHRVDLVEKAKEAWAAKKANGGSGNSLITNPDDPKFDLEKLLESYDKS